MSTINIPNDDEFVHEAKAPQYFGVKHRRTLKRWRDLGEGPPFVRIGRKVYYRGGAIRQWLLARERAA